MEELYMAAVEASQFAYNDRQLLIFRGILWAGGDPTTEEGWQGVLDTVDDGVARLQRATLMSSLIPKRD